MLYVNLLHEEVHDALSKNEIVSVEFQWIHYMFKGFASGPGFYAGIQSHTKWQVVDFSPGKS